MKVCLQDLECSPPMCEPTSVTLSNTPAELAKPH